MIESPSARWARASGFAALGLALACRAAETPRGPADRTAERPAILEEVLRCEIRQFVGEDGPGAGASVCVAVSDGGSPSDPSDAIVQRLRRTSAVRPRSACRGDQDLVLIAGPIEWRKDDEVYASGAYVRSGRGETPLKYRVVWDQGRWACVGPILSWDPL